MANWWDILAEDDEGGLASMVDNTPAMHHGIPVYNNDPTVAPITPEPEKVNAEVPAIMPRPEGNTPKPAVAAGPSGFNPNSAIAKKYSSILKDWRGDRMSGESEDTYSVGGTTMNAPQQYGQDLTPADPDEGPLDPEETAQRLASGENRIVNLGPPKPRGMIKSRNDGYQQYVETERAKRDEQREAQRHRAVANRADIADRNARTQQQLYDTNRIQGAGGQMGAYDENGPSVSRIGGLTILRGRMRPRTEEESADLDYKRAQTDFMRQKPQVASEGNAIKIAELQRKMAEDAAKNERFNKSLGSREKFKKEGHELDVKMADSLIAGRQADLADTAAKVQARLERIAQTMKIKLAAAKEKTKFGFGDPDPGAVDYFVDPDTMELTDRKVEGDFDLYKDMMATEIERLRKVNPGIKTLPPSVQAVLDMLP